MVKVMNLDSLKIGDYVFATKYADGDPVDGWAVGFYDGVLHNINDTRYLVVDSDGNKFRRNGFRKIQKISKEVGDNIIDTGEFNKYDYPNWPEAGQVNLWEKLSDIERKLKIGNSMTEIEIIDAIDKLINESTDRNQLWCIATFLQAKRDNAKFKSLELFKEEVEKMVDGDKVNG